MGQDCLFKSLDWIIPSRHTLSKWRRINVDGIDVDTTSFSRCVPAGIHVIYILTYRTCILQYCPDFVLLIQSMDTRLPPVTFTSPTIGQRSSIKNYLIPLEIELSSWLYGKSLHRALFVIIFHWNTAASEIEKLPNNHHHLHHHQYRRVPLRISVCARRFAQLTSKKPHTIATFKWRFYAFV